MINSKQGLSSNKSVILQKLIPGNHLRIHYSFGPDLRWAKSPIASAQRAIGQLWQAIAQFHVERMLNQSRDSNRGTTNVGPVRTNFCVSGGDMTANER